MAFCAGDVTLDH